MPSRILREGILSSDRVNALSVEAEVFYRRLMSVVDDFGRFDGRPSMLRVSCYPLRVDAVHETDITDWIVECATVGLIVVYIVDGKPYLEVQEFKQQERSKSKFPPPSAGQLQSYCLPNAKRVNGTCHADAKQVQTPVHLFRISDSESDFEVGDSSEPVGSEQPSGFAIPLNDGTEYAVATRQLAEWAQSFPAVDVKQQLREMRAWSLANKARRKTRRGVEAFAVRWLQKAQDNPGKGNKPAGNPDDWTGAAH